jgi:hypothetical protein
MSGFAQFSCFYQCGPVEGYFLQKEGMSSKKIFDRAWDPGMIFKFAA